jgi:hypothetical protein
MTRRLGCSHSRKHRQDSSDLPTEPVLQVLPPAAPDRIEPPQGSHPIPHALRLRGQPTSALLEQQHQLDQGLIDPLAPIVILKHFDQLLRFPLDVLQSFLRREAGHYALAGERRIEGAHEILVVEPKGLVVRVCVQSLLNQSEFCRFG